MVLTGVYVITWSDSADALDVSGIDNRSSMVFRRNRYVNQQWTLEWVEGENYRIKGGLGYVCFRGQEQHNTPIECSEIPQVWRIVPVPGATNSMYIMHDASPHLVLDVMRQQDNNLRVHLRRFNQNAPQTWKFERITPTNM